MPLMPIRLRRLTMALTDRRRDASRLAYVPAFLVLALLTPHAIEDGGWYFPVLLLVCGGQMWRPTFAGWGLVTAAFAIWAVTLIAPGGGSFHERGEYSLFLGLALIPTAALLLFRPKCTAAERGVILASLILGGVVVAALACALGCSGPCRGCRFFSAVVPDAFVVSTGAVLVRSAGARPSATVRGAGVEPSVS